MVGTFITQTGRLTASVETSPRQVGVRISHDGQFVTLLNITKTMASGLSRLGRVRLLVWGLGRYDWVTRSVAFLHSFLCYPSDFAIFWFFLHQYSVLLGREESQVVLVQVECLRELNRFCANGDK